MKILHTFLIFLKKNFFTSCIQFTAQSVFETFLFIHRTEPEILMSDASMSPIRHCFAPPETESYTTVTSLPCNQDHASLY